MEEKLFVKDKFKQLVYVLISHYDNKNGLNANILYKILYFCDFNNYEIYESSITGETYVHKRNGPYPVHIKQSIKELIKEDIIIENRNILDSKIYYNIKNIIDVNFNDNEMNVIKTCLNKLGNMKIRCLTEYTLNDKPLRLSKEAEEINYEAVFYRTLDYQVKKS